LAENHRTGNKLKRFSAKHTGAIVKPAKALPGNLF